MSGGWAVVENEGLIPVSVTAFNSKEEAKANLVVQARAHGAEVQSNLEGPGTFAQAGGWEGRVLPTSLPGVSIARPRSGWAEVLSEGLIPYSVSIYGDRPAAIASLTKEVAGAAGGEFESEDYATGRNWEGRILEAAIIAPHQREKKPNLRSE